MPLDAARAIAESDDQRFEILFRRHPPLALRAGQPFRARPGFPDQKDGTSAAVFQRIDRILATTGFRFGFGLAPNRVVVFSIARTQPPPDRREGKQPQERFRDAPNPGLAFSLHGSEFIDSRFQAGGQVAHFHVVGEQFVDFVPHRKRIRFAPAARAFLEKPVPFLQPSDLRRRQMPFRFLGMAQRPMSTERQIRLPRMHGAGPGSSLGIGLRRRNGVSPLAGFALLPGRDLQRVHFDAQGGRVGKSRDQFFAESHGFRRQSLFDPGRRLALPLVLPCGLDDGLLLAGFGGEFAVGIIFQVPLNIIAGRAKRLGAQMFFRLGQRQSPRFSFDAPLRFFQLTTGFVRMVPLGLGLQISRVSLGSDHKIVGRQTAIGLGFRIPPRRLVDLFLGGGQLRRRVFVVRIQIQIAFQGAFEARPIPAFGCRSGLALECGHLVRFPNGFGMQLTCFFKQFPALVPRQPNALRQ